jgi:hypothetical protein
VGGLPTLRDTGVPRSTVLDHVNACPCRRAQKPGLAGLEGVWA